MDGIDALRLVLQYRRGNVGGLGDFDKDSDVDGADLAVFATHFGRTDYYDAYQVRATATDEEGTYVSNTLSVVDPPLPNNPVDQVPSAPAPAKVHVPDLGRMNMPAAVEMAGVPVRSNAEAPGGGLKYEQLNFIHDPAFGRVLGGWQAGTRVMGEEFKLFEFKPWNLPLSWSLVDDLPKSKNLDYANSEIFLQFFRDKATALSRTRQSCGCFIQYSLSNATNNAMLTIYIS